MMGPSERYVCVIMCVCDMFFIVNKIEMLFQLYGVCMCVCQQSEIYSYVVVVVVAVVVVVVVSWCL